MRQVLVLQLPRFLVDRIELDPPQLVGRVSGTHYGETEWVTNGSLGDLRSDEILVTGRWESAGELWSFHLGNLSDLQKVLDLRDFEIWEGYWGERAEFVLDRDLEWRESEFDKSDDHAHCRICWLAISASENAHHWRLKEGTVACERCYVDNILPRSLDFSRIGGPAA